MSHIHIRRQPLPDGTPVEVLRRDKSLIAKCTVVESKYTADIWTEPMQGSWHTWEYLLRIESVGKPKWNNNAYMIRYELDGARWTQSIWQSDHYASKELGLCFSIVATEQPSEIKQKGSSDPQETASSIKAKDVDESAKNAPESED